MDGGLSEGDCPESSCSAVVGFASPPGELLIHTPNHTLNYRIIPLHQITPKNEV